MMRKIIHLDLDAFFCAVEERKNPSLIGKPFAVGGRPDERGVIASCSYAARMYGIHSAMPTSRALRLCPGLLIVRSRHGDYSKISREVMEYLYNISPLVEQISIDEAFVDISDLPDSGQEIAKKLQKTINDEMGLPCSIGIASNKLVAKIANYVGKSKGQSGVPPNAITDVPAGTEADFLAPLKVEKLWGVGPKTADHLAKIGVTTIGELARCSEKELIRLFGKSGIYLSRHSKGIDDSPIVTFHEPKSISQETTFTKDIRDVQQLHRTLRELAVNVGTSLRKEGYSCTTIKIKLRWPDFTTITRQFTLTSPIDQDQLITEVALMLFEKAWKPGKAVRLIGVGVSGLESQAHQLSLWDDAPKAGHSKENQLQVALDELRERFGQQSIRHASDLPIKGVKESGKS